MARTAGRPSADTLAQERLARICDRHANGEPLPRVCKEEGMTQAEFRREVRKVSGLQALWEDARKEYVHSLFNLMAELSDDLAKAKYGRDDNASVSAKRTALDGLKHVTARLNPAAYGEQKAGAQGVTVIINTDMPLGDGSGPGKTIEGDFKVMLPVGASK